jgi:AcrR family transcriptional regulator
MERDMEDARVRKTKARLYKALAELMEKKPFEQIKISELTREARVSRKTFYNHYDDKEDLVRKYQDNLSRNIQSIMSRYPTVGTQVFADLFDYLNRCDELLIRLMSDTGSLRVQSILRGTIEDDCRTYVANADIPADFAEYEAIMLAGMIFSVVKHWLSTGKKTPPQRMAEIMSGLIGGKIEMTMPGTR